MPKDVFIFANFTMEKEYVEVNAAHPVMATEIKFFDKSQMA